MFLTLKSLLGKKQKPARKARRRTFLPTIDTLEDRRVMAVLFVDDNLQQFPAAQYTTIQAAVNAAQPGDTIKVFAGKYNEQVSIPASKPRLTLVGASTGPQFAINPQLASIVDPPAAATGYGILVAANDTVINGFTLGDIDDDRTTDTAGIGTLASISGFTISGNVVTDSTFGLYLHSSGVKASTVSGNWIYANNDVEGGVGIYSISGAQNIQIVGNTITDHSIAAIYLAASTVYTQTNLRIEGNTVGDASRAGSGNEILLFNVTNSTVSNNTSYNSISRGIDIAGASSNIVVSNNTIVNPAWTGIDVISGFIGPPNTQIQVTGNRISGAGQNGIRLSGATSGSVVSNNTVTGSRNTIAQGGNGIVINNAYGNTITGNTLTNNVNNGILVTATSSGNTFTGNVAVLNGDGVTTFDLTDLSTGGGTAGTANFWAGNTAIRRNRPGI